MKNGFDGIVARATWTKSIEVSRQLGFPLGFQGLTHKRLPRPFVLGGNSKRPLVRSAAFRNPDASKRGGFTIKLKLARKPPSLGRGE
jgi:hypothetical protein